MANSCALRVLLVGCPADLARAVQDGGREAATADAVSALRHVRAASPDVVILDLSGIASAGGDPTELARRIRAESLWPKPFFLALADADACEREGALKAGGIDLLLVKPVHPGLITEFLGRLEAVLQEYRAFDPAI